MRSYLKTNIKRHLQENYKFYGICLVVMGITLLSPELVFAREIEEVGSYFATKAINIARGVALLGCAVAGVAWGVPGCAHHAAGYFRGFVLASLCTFGGPAIVNFLRGAF